MAGNDDVHAQALQSLMDKVRADQFPSATMLDMIEGMLQDQDVEAYTSALLDKVRHDQFPSLDLLRRLLAFA